MNTILSKIVLSSFALIGAASLAACSGAPGGESNASTDEASSSSIYACKVDSDCTAIPAMGCCPDGSYVAVNTHKVSQYEDSHVCTHQQICPLHVIHETRVAQCNFQKKKCEMIQPTDIHCGGFINPNHQCPTGFACDLTQHVPDTGGTCKASAPTCIQRVMCLSTEHFDHGVCACVPN